MTENNNIDDIFRNGLEGLEVNPPEKSWDSLEAGLEKEYAVRKRNSRWRFFFYAGLALLISFTAYKYYSTETSKNLPGEEQSSTTTFKEKGNKLSSPVASTSNAIIESNIQKPAIDLKKSSSEKQISIPENAKSTETLKKENNIAGEINSTQKEMVVAEKQTLQPSVTSGIRHEKFIAETDVNARSTEKVTTVSIATTKTANINSTEKTINTPAEITDTNVSNNSQADATADVTTGSKETTSTPETQSLVETPASSNARQEIKTENAPVESKTNAAVPAAIIAAGNETKKPDSKSFTENSSQPKTETQTFTEQSTPAEKNSEPSLTEKSETTPVAADPSIQTQESSKSFFKTVVSHMAVEAYYSPDYVNSRLKPNESYSGTASKDPADYNNQKAAFSYSTGINVLYDLGSHWSMGSGVAYSTFNQTAVYNTINVVSDSIYQDEHGHGEPHSGGGPGGGGGGAGGGHHDGGHGGNNPHNPPPGNNNDHHYVVQTPCGAIDLYKEPPHHDAGNHQNGDTLNIKTETTESIQFINVPLFVRYNFSKNKFKFFVSGGASINFVKGDKVKVVVDDAYTEENEHDGLKNTNYSLLFGVGVEYNFYKKLNVFLNPTFRYSITPVNQYNPMDSYPYYLGMGAGLSIHF
jgi:hypothetical protein